MSIPNAPASTDLIARLETAGDGHENIDIEIGDLLDSEAAARGETRRIVPYTFSLDAALTLVPPGMWWTVAAGKVTPDEPLFGAAVYRPEYSAASMQPIAVGEHPTSAAIALCIAALKARA